MASEKDVKRQWSQALRAMVATYRANNPNDSRSNIELVESMMESFYEAGLVQKCDDKYVLPELEGDFPLIN